jgi:preprotein translocase subunit SecG
VRNGNGILEVVTICLTGFWIVSLIVLAWAIATAAPNDEGE